jgi:predicted RNA polymerase sigma factor
MSEPRALVEHFFRHEFGRLVAVLTRSLGVRRLALVEDVVQAALVQALEIWSRRGVPEDPAGWLYRTARNLAIDALRRERTTPRHCRAWPKTPSACRDLCAEARRLARMLAAQSVGDAQLPDNS